MNKTTPVTIYLLMADNGELLCVSTSQRQMMKAVVQKLHDGSISYCCDSESTDTPDMASGTSAQVREFRHDWKACLRKEINSKLQGGYLDITHSGELL